MKGFCERKGGRLLRRRGWGSRVEVLFWGVDEGGDVWWG